jgi:hypothetical protein
MVWSATLADDGKVLSSQLNPKSTPVPAAQALPVLGPGLRQVQLPVNQRPSGPRGIRQEHPDLQAELITFIPVHSGPVATLPAVLDGYERVHTSANAVNCNCNCSHKPVLVKHSNEAR